MNPADFGMFWMNQYAQAQERMIIDDSTSYYSQASAMDDLSHQTGTMDMSTLGLINSEFTAITAPGPMAITPELFGGLPRALASVGQHQHFHDDQHQTILDHYAINPSFLTTTASVNVGTGTDTYEEDDDDEAENQNMCDEQFANQFVNQFTNNEDENSLDENEEIDEDEYHEGTDSNNSNSLGFDAAGTQISGQNSKNAPPFKRRTKGTQTNRKIKPVKRPGLVLKTPIAYQPCLDPSVIPIQRDGMAVCERCGAIGVKHSFYTKERRFCSMACARGDFVMMQMQAREKLKQSEQPSQTDDKPTNIEKTKGKNSTTMNDIQDATTGTSSPVDVEAQLKNLQSRIPNYRFKLTMNGNGTNGKNDSLDGMDVNEAGSVLYRDIMFEEEVPQIPKPSTLPEICPQDEKITTVRRKPSEFLNSYDWLPQLSNLNFFAAPVTCFAHAPGNEIWSMVDIGMKVEVENTDCDTPELKQVMSPHSFWVATVLRLCGYKALLRYEGFDDDSSHDFWVNLCSSEVHSVGWCGTRGKPLIPPRTIENKYSWRKYLEEKLTGALTLPTSFYNKINESSKSRFRVGLQLEVVNKNRISQMRLARIHKIVGKRLLVRYFDAPDDNGFWVHEDSPLIHPVGWSIDVSHNLSAPPEYTQRMLEGQDQALEMHEDDATMDLFKMNFSFKEYFLDGKVSGFKAGMKLEAVDPLNLSSICVATVCQVLKFGYMMIRIDTYDPDITGADLFCYHEKSACIFPPGFCQQNKITLTPPKGYDNKSFTWPKYLSETKSIAASEDLFCLDVPDNGFREGMKIECADLMDPRLVCVATIVKIVGRVLRVHFDGWEDEFDQWLDRESPDMYPVGWCVMVGHKLEAPKPQVVQKISPKSTAKRGRRKKGSKTDAKGRLINLRNMKKEYDEHKQNDFDESQNGNSFMKMEETQEDEGDEDDDDYSHDDYSHSINSTSLPSTPEPRNATPTFHTARPSSKSSSFSDSMNSQMVGNFQMADSVTTTSSPTPERKMNVSAMCKNIPCLIPGGAISQHSNEDLLPNTWNASDVAEFLTVNDCGAHCETFTKLKIDGKRMLEMTNDEIVRMLSMKVGPALKIYDLIQQLKLKMKSSRHSVGKTSASKKYL